MKPIIHIGLGKTGTTFLQLDFLPKILKFTNRIYWKNDLNLTSKILDHINLMIYDQTFKKVNLPKNIFISNESLLGPSGWDPFYYEKFADLNLKAFGPNCEILITIREPKTWLRSNYTRNIGKLNIIKETEYYLNNNDHEKKDLYIFDRHCLFFALEKFSYKKLIDIYSQRFSKVTILKYENLKNIKNWENIFDQKLNIQKDNDLFKNKIFNKGLSKSSIRLSITINSFLKFFNLSIEKFQLFINSLRLDNNNKFIIRYYNRLINFLRWKKFLKFMDKIIFKSEPYELKKNNFINNEITRLEKEYRSIE